jgi:TAT-translocated FGD2 family F420-dependent dehydrogenase
MGTGVTCPSYRYNPAIVAQVFASLGVLYPGRVFLGVGSGEAINEEATTGDWGDYDERSDRMVEAVTLIRKLWAGEWVNHQGQYYQVKARLYDIPKKPVPIYMAAGGPESAELAGRYGDGLVTDAKSAIKPEMRQAFQEGAKAAGKDPKAMTIHAESFVFVGKKEDAKQAANLWRFVPKAWTEFVENPDPRDILRKAEAEVSIEEATKDWVIGEQASAHIEAIQKMVDGGVTHIYIHSGQADQRRVIDFYSREVLPHIQHERMQARV